MRKDLLFFIVLFLSAAFYLYFYKGNGLQLMRQKFPQAFEAERAAAQAEAQLKDLRPEAAPLTILLQSSVQQYTLNHSVPIIVILQNSSQQAVPVFKLFAVTSALEFEAKPPRDIQLMRRSFPDYDFSTDKDLYWLSPGEMVQGIIDLNQYFHFDSPGQYQIQAVYRGFKNGQPRSNPIVFELDQPK